jgi:hypothetical protein
MASDDRSGRVREAPLLKEVGDAEMDTQIEAMTSSEGSAHGAHPTPSQVLSQSHIGHSPGFPVQCTPSRHV